MKNHLCDVGPRRVVVLAHGLRAGGGLPVGQNLISALLRCEPKHNYLAVVPANVGYESLELESRGVATHYYERKAGHFGRVFFDDFVLPKVVRDYAPDLILALGNKGLTKPPCRQAILCHDPHLFYPSKHFPQEPLINRLTIAYMRRHLRKSLTATDMLLAQTSVAESRLVSTYSYDGKTALCPNAISTEAVQPARDSTLPSSLERHSNQLKLFCLTRYYPHKNLEAIVDTFERYREDLTNVVAILTLDRSQHRCAGRLLDRISALGLDEQIVNVGPLRQDELAKYYAQCDALILPSFLESFSRTYVEAMHFGTPILASNLDFAKEVCGDAALYFDPWSAESIRDSILELRHTPRSKLANFGKRRLECLENSWDKIASDLLVEIETLWNPRTTAA